LGELTQNLLTKVNHFFNYKNCKKSVFLFSQYSRLPETHTVRTHQDVSTDIQEFLDTSINKLTSPLQVSLLDVKAFLLDVEVKRFQHSMYCLIFFSVCEIGLSEMINANFVYLSVL